MFNKRVPLIALLCIVTFGSLIKAEIKPLYEINIIKNENYPAERYEKGVLQNAGTAQETLEVKGYYSVRYVVENTAQAYEARTDFVADKHGYRAKFKIVLSPRPQITLSPRLGANTLKTTVG